MSDLKQIFISGSKNKQDITKATTNIQQDKEIKRRVASEKWTFSEEYFNYENQLKLINEIAENEYKSISEVAKIAVKQINTKISGYKQQDTLKKRYNEEQFITFEHIINTMLECELRCRYCKLEINVLYDISREMKQWSVDRIDNDIGHNNNNYHLACLECNLKRRRKSDDKFLFTKQLNLIKQDN